MGGLVIVVLDPKSLALMVLGGVLDLTQAYILIPQPVWGPLAADLSDPVGFALHGWLERNKHRVRLLRTGKTAAAIELDRSAIVAVVSEQAEVREVCLQAGRAALIGVSVGQLCEALQAQGAVFSADAAMAAAHRGLEARAATGRELPAGDEGVDLARRLVGHIEMGVLSLG